MQLFATFLLAAFGKLFDFFAALLGKKIALGTAVLATSLALLTAFFVAIKTLIATLVTQITNTYILMGLYAIWPANSELCISAYWTAQLTAFIYREHRDNLRALSNIT